MTKGAETRDRIVDRAFRIASREGLEGLSIGTLATELAMSKSGLFAHFGSKEDLQLAVLEAASVRFQETVVRPAFKAPRGLPRVRKLFDLWIRWMTDPSLPGGCLFVAAATELDDRQGRPRDFLVATERTLLDAIAKSARLAVEEGHFVKKLDVEQFAYELHAFMLAFNHAHRLMEEPLAEERTRAAFERLVASASKS
jgi:AcrR family transcriptional regulator